MATSQNQTSFTANEAEEFNQEESLLEVLFSAAHRKADPNPPKKRRKRRRIHGVVIGELSGRNEFGEPLVDYPGSPAKQALPSRTTMQWTEKDLGKQVVLMFERGNPRKPIMLGFLQTPQPQPAPRSLPAEPILDGERLVFTADKEIVLRCGKASLTLTQAGKVLLRGAYLLSRSSGVNRIKGGSVQIN